MIFECDRYILDVTTKMMKNKKIRVTKDIIAVLEKDDKQTLEDILVSVFPMIIKKYDAWVYVCPQLDKLCLNLISIVKDFRYNDLLVAAKFCLSLMRQVAQYKNRGGLDEDSVTDYKSALNKLTKDHNVNALRKNFECLKLVSESYSFILEECHEHSDWLSTYVK